MSRQGIDSEVAESLAGVVRLMRRAAELAWVAADLGGAGSTRQMLALGIDLAADQAHHMLPDGYGIDGPIPVGHQTPALLRSAAQLLERITTTNGPAELHHLQVKVQDLVWEANTGAGAN